MLQSFGLFAFDLAQRGLLRLPCQSLDGGLIEVELPLRATRCTEDYQHERERI